VSDPLDPVFKALADEHRRALLDALRERDGRTLSELCEIVSEMSRFGVMKHLAVLEAAELVVTHRAGRSKHHYLNPVPIARIQERWISKYAAVTVDALLGLRQAVET
jgi:DNA-binding transcriptional ArsR family regulator